MPISKLCTQRGAAAVAPNDLYWYLAVAFDKLRVKDECNKICELRVAYRYED
ncbi:uncharacterized protein PHALS_07523 [Plasmopara halstedii]|uniref:Uncharacterized protein n=1 Tax=Plasmopara halstedii TaxID=4781 RepID=A0A0P1B7G0_PLAHL|nr:uncharacterized protein PHALS_07523 [Plasmopara halstedii]CEG49777.1 hypothetical protein PHALS_07523 [Plasmopara halstedii]|eukprot:XP_024586146.1 hypothetical protein PHALS_07523 [Plasmopara halstedii]